MNKIKFTFIDGAPTTVDHNLVNNMFTYHHHEIFSKEDVELDTERILCEGDSVSYKDYFTHVRERIYHPGSESFDFVCEDVYSGKLTQ